MSIETSTTPTSCYRCKRVLRDLPHDARFCPKCGAGLPMQAVVDSSRPSMRERMEQIHSMLHGHLAADPSTPSVEKLHSLMLLGYANAMLQLGWRYEHGSGVARNPSEAERCYTKSAKLGNIYARSRVGDAPMDIPAEEAVPVEQMKEASQPPPLPS